MDPFADRDPADRPDPGAPGEDVTTESRLVWIFGSARTGSSWLLRMLLHPWRLAANEIGVRQPARPAGRGSPPIIPVNESHLPLHLTPQNVPRYERELAPEPATFLANTRRAKDTHYFFNEQYATAWRPHVRALALARFRAQAERIERGRGDGVPIVIKEPNGSHGAELVMDLLPRARLLFLMRDGRDVVDSQLALRVPGGARSDGTRNRPIVGHEQRLAAVLRNSRLWVNNMTAVKAAYDAHDPDLRYLLRYEDLRRDTGPELKALREWLGVAADHRAVEAAVRAEAFESVPRRNKGFGRGKRVAQPGHWRKTLMPLEQRVAEEVMAGMLEELGYAVGGSA